MSKATEEFRVGPGPLPPLGVLHRFALVFSGVLSPPMMGAFALVVIGGASTWPASSGLEWAIVSAMGCGAPPLVYVCLTGRRAHSLTVSRLALHRLGRGQRITAAIITLAALAADLVLMIKFHGPGQLVKFLVFSAGGVVTAAALTRIWKISVHTGVMVSVLGLLSATYGFWAIFGVPLACVMGWARVRVGAHTPMEVACGLLFGLAWVFLFVRLGSW
ncbi:phosphatase PAP2 family protein [Streptomyces sp. CA-181903]|uniref:phosphatase PAP2 family protein n=1 Tax=Streptomyces sp. CA-181903 TaxID=3240055 RepID=UPI003D903123